MSPRTKTVFYLFTLLLFPYSFSIQQAFNKYLLFDYFRFQNKFYVSNKDAQLASAYFISVYKHFYDEIVLWLALKHTSFSKSRFFLMTLTNSFNSSGTQSFCFTSEQLYFLFGIFLLRCLIITVFSLSLSLTHSHTILCSFAFSRTHGTEDLF